MRGHHGCSSVNETQQALPNSCCYNSPPQERTKGTSVNILSRSGLLLLPATGLSSQNPADTGPMGTPTSCAACCNARFTGGICMTVNLLARALSPFPYIAASPIGLRLLCGFLQIIRKADDGGFYGSHNSGHSGRRHSIDKSSTLYSGNMPEKMRAPLRLMGRTILPCLC